MFITAKKRKVAYSFQGIYCYFVIGVHLKVQVV